jgi:SAM-dependent methyltransferase
MPCEYDKTKDPSSVLSMPEYFDELYGAADPRYWWNHPEPYSTDPDDYPYSLLTQLTLRAISDLQPGRALDLGAGEGADSIRLAKLGYEVTAVEISNVGAQKILKFADEENIRVNVQVADIASFRPQGMFDLVICNGVLHYVRDKESVIETMQRATRPGGLNVISLWSAYTRVPECHARVPVYCDHESGVVLARYRQWRKVICYFERDKPESAHEEMPEHSHSHIKMIASKPI